MHKTDAVRLKRPVPKMAKSYQSKNNDDFMQEIHSNELDLHVNNGKECNANVIVF